MAQIPAPADDRDLGSHTLLSGSTSPNFEEELFMRHKDFLFYKVKSTKDGRYKM